MKALPEGSFDDSASLDAPPMVGRSDLEKRYDVDDHFCEKPGTGSYAYKSVIQREIKRLYGISGKPVNGPGPGNCGRVSCSSFSGIYWCNDVSLTLILV